MKKLSLLILAVVVITQLSAQKISVSESGDAVVTTIYDTDEGDIAKDWKSLMKKYDAKVDVSKHKVEAKGASIKSMSSGTFDVTANLDKIKEGEVKFSVIFDPIASAESKTPDRSSYMSEAKNIVKDFAKKRTYESVSELVKDAQKAQDKLQKQHDGFVKDNTDLADDIENYKKKITNAERDIEVNKDKISAKKKEIEEHQKVLDDVIKKQKAVD
jgi:septal ring factor EnvC (AmiA/AmiB activator)